jgi:uncharacterized protein CbrC (UPF0167 family)
VSKLPIFKYHPDPVATGSVVASDELCECCGEARGYVYCQIPYGEKEIEFICPWCISDGSANRKLGASFADSWRLSQEEIPQEIIDEVKLRTPGYFAWQGESWLACRNDACEFHGDAPAEELNELDASGLAALSGDTGFPIEDLPGIIASYQPKGRPRFHKFVCRHCGSTRYSGDCDQHRKRSLTSAFGC